MKEHINFYIYDFEVLKWGWCVTFKNLETKEYLTIRNNIEQLEMFTQNNLKSIFIGFNNAGYDQYIWDCILTGWDPYELSQKIIVESQRPWTFYKEFKYRLINYDIYKNLPYKQSLKMCEANLGLEIKESELLFQEDEPLTEEKWQELIKYNMVDDDATEAIWEIFRPDFESKLLLLQMFKLPIQYISKSNAQLTAIILQAEKSDRWQKKINNDILDKDYYVAPKNLILTKYKHIREKFGNFIPDEFKSFTTEVAEAKHTFGTGGLHGEGNLHYWEGILIIADFFSYYPMLMILYDYLSRNVKNTQLFKEIVNKRAEYKSQSKSDEIASKMANAFKLVINTVSGAQRAKFNDLYDPRMGKAFCITGQLFMVDLIEKIEPYLDKNGLIQSNTDGIFFKVRNKETLELIKREFKKWEKRTGLRLEIDYAKRIWQKDVNNYLMELANGEIKFKGSWLKSNKGQGIEALSPSNAIVVNDAVKYYLLYGIEPKYYFEEEHPLIDFQFVAKGGGMYKHFYQFVDDQYVELQKVNRVFATNILNYGTLYKKKADKETYEKVANMPPNCLIINENIIGNTNHDLGDLIDYKYYEKLAWERINEFLK